MAKKTTKGSSAFSDEQLEAIGKNLLPAMKGWRGMADAVCLGLESGSYGSFIIEEFIKPPELKHRIDEKDVFKHIDYPINEGGALVLVDKYEYHETRPEDRAKLERYRLDQRSLLIGLARTMLDAPSIYAQLAQDEGDALTGDAFIQYCLLKEHVYG